MTKKEPEKSIDVLNLKVHKNADMLAAMNATYNKRCGYKKDLSNRDLVMERKRIPTGVFELDYYTGGGIPEHVPTMLVGLRESGKSTLCQKLAAEAQKKYPDKIVIYFDMEGHLILDQAVEHGVNIDPNAFVVLMPETGQQMGDLIVDYAREFPGRISLIIIDSVTAATDAALLDKSVEDRTIASTAGVMTTFCQQYEAVIRGLNEKGLDKPTLLMINHLRANFDKGFKGDPYRIAGGAKILDFSYLVLKTGKLKRERGEGLEAVELKHFNVAFEKNKLGLGEPSHIEWSMYVSNQDPFTRGTVNDFRGVIGRAKEAGIHAGGANKQKLLGIGIDDVTFKTMDEMEKYLFSNQDVYAKLKALIISKHRERIGKSAYNEAEPDFMIDYVGVDLLGGLRQSEVSKGTEQET
jgi:RecA/RadA recombinase